MKTDNVNEQAEGDVSLDFFAEHLVAERTREIARELLRLRFVTSRYVPHQSAREMARRQRQGKA
jgi:hypothetical protein